MGVYGTLAQPKKQTGSIIKKFHLVMAQCWLFKFASGFVFFVSFSKLVWYSVFVFLTNNYIGS